MVDSLVSEDDAGVTGGERRLRFRAPWVIFWVAFGLRVAAILIGHTYKIRTDQAEFNFGFEAGRIARSVATGQGFANPFNGVSGPSAWLPPLYPLLMGAVFKLFGVYTNAAGLALLVVNSLFSAAVAPAVYEIAARCFDARGIARRSSKYAAPVALWSAWLWAVYPAALQYAIHWVWEMSLTVFLFSWAVVVALRLRGVGEEKQGLGIREQGLALWVGLGVLWGLIALSNASLLLCLPAMIVWVAWPRSREKSREQLTVNSEQGTVRSGWWGGWRWVVGGVGLTTVAFAVVLAPWVVRNERVLHAFVPTRSNFGVELYESTLERNDGFPWGTTVPLWTGDPEFKQFVRMGEVRFAKMRGEEAKERIRARPWRTAKWTLDRFLFFWDGTPHPPDRHPAQEYLRQLSYCFLSVCGLLGLVLMLRRRVEGAGLFALIFVLLPLPYYLVTVQPRFRHPMEPLIAVLAVYLFRSAEKKGIREQGLGIRKNDAEA
jgi:hypothetical protein